MNVDYCWWVRWKQIGKGGVCVHVSTHLIGIMLQRTVIAHVSHSVQICVSLVHIVHIGTVVLLVQYTWELDGNVV